MKALFVDLTGVLLEAGTGPLERAGLRSGASAALRLLERLDYRLFVLGPCDGDRRQRADVMADRIADLLLREQVALSGYSGCVCARTPCEGCAPGPGVLLRSAAEQGIVLASSWLLGARPVLIEAGVRAGCRTVLVGDDPAWTPGAHPGAVRVAGDVYAAALLIARLEHAA